MFDSHSLYDVAGELQSTSADMRGPLQRAYVAIRSWLKPDTLPRYHEFTWQDNGKRYAEVANALSGHKSSMVRLNERDEVIVSVAIPVQRMQVVYGALMLSTQGSEIDDMVNAEWLAMLKVSLVGLVVTLIMGGLAVLTVRRAFGLK